MTDNENLIYAGFWIRVLASLIDTLLSAFIIFPFLIAIYGTEYFDSLDMFQGPADIFFSYVLPAAAVIVFWICKSATPGKMAISAKIVDAQTGLKPSVGQYIGRYFAYYISMLPMGLGFLWVAFDSRKQGWHDKLAGTVVIRTTADRNR